MQSTSLALLALTMLAVASVPLWLVWRSPERSKYRKLVWVGVFLTFDLIVFGAYTRLTDSGLGCPDWPGCYGLANPFLAHEQISQAQALMPTGPVTLPKAWIEMIHRFLAGGIGFLIAVSMVWSGVQWRATKRAEYAPAVPTALFLLVCLQGAFGAWTVTMKLQPVIVTTHLLLGMALLSLMVWIGSRHDHVGVRPVSDPALRPVRALALASAALLLAQIALGGWVSTNYAALACNDYPLCGGQLVPNMDFEQGFTLWRALGKTAAGHYLPFGALVAIHWVHRNFALLVIAVLGVTAWRAWPHPALRRTARRIALVLALQAATGIATIFLDWPLAIAVLHNAGAAALVLLVTMLNYGAKFHSGSAPATASAPLSPSTLHP
jgi:cytochrome c oxidase assembly protein subunit 15